MARTLRTPNSGSQISTSGSLACSNGRDVWIGFTTPPTSSGSVTLFHTASEIAGSILCSIVACPLHSLMLPTPINSPTGLYAACISGGSVFWWLTR